MEKSLLLVDDNDSVRMLLTGYLERLGWVVVAAPTAAEAVDSFRRQRTSVALVDYRLPDQNGDELARELRRMRPDVRIVFLTADRSFDVSSPVAPVIPKPVELGQLASTLEKVVSQSVTARSGPT